MSVFSVQPEDTGEYICFAKNPVGAIEASARLRVNSPPRFSKYPENVRVNAGRTAVFECEAVGQPQPGIFWNKEGDQVNKCVDFFCKFVLFLSQSVFIYCSYFDGGNNIWK